MTHRLNWGALGQQSLSSPVAFAQGVADVDGEPALVDQELRQRQTTRDIYGLLAYPFSEVQRVEFQAGFSNISFDNELRTRAFSLETGEQILDDEVDLPAGSALNLGVASAALVYDNSFPGATGPLFGQRYRLELSPTFGSISFVGVLADFRKYIMPVRPFTLAARVLHYGRYGSGGESARLQPIFLGIPAWFGDTATGPSTPRSARRLPAIPMRVRCSINCSGVGWWWPTPSFASRSLGFWVWAPGITGLSRSSLLFSAMPGWRGTRRTNPQCLARHPRSGIQCRCRPPVQPLRICGGAAELGPSLRSAGQRLDLAVRAGAGVLVSFPCTPPATTTSLPIPTPTDTLHTPKGRIIVIAPTRAACETIELALGLHLETLLEREHGEEIRELAAIGQGLRHRGRHRHRKDARHPPDRRVDPERAAPVGVVNREREATPETPSWNVVIVTTGIARRWFQDDLITGRDTIIVDEIHQTSAELELCLALGKRAGCRFIWLSATVDPTFYARYLDSADVLETYAFDPALKAKVQVLPQTARRVPQRALHPPRDEGEARRRGVSSRPARKSSDWRASLGEQWKRLTTGVLPRRRADPGHPAVPGGGGRAALPAGDDRGRPIGAQRPRARHGGDLRRALRQRGRTRQERAPPALSRRQRDPADGRAGARPGAERRGGHPQRPATSTSRSSVPRHRSSSWPATRSGWRSPAPRSA